MYSVGLTGVEKIDVTACSMISCISRGSCRDSRSERTPFRGVSGGGAQNPLDLVPSAQGAYGGNEKMIPRTVLRSRVRSSSVTTSTEISACTLTSVSVVFTDVNTADQNSYTVAYTPSETRHRSRTRSTVPLITKKIVYLSAQIRASICAKLKTAARSRSKTYAEEELGGRGPGT